MSPAKKSPLIVTPTAADTKLIRPRSATAAMVARCRAAILKSTGEKPLEQSVGQMPHVPTGSLAVDMLIGGTPAKDGSGPMCPGFPRRRIIEVFGKESSGKTTLLLSAMAQTQKMGGACLFVDFEHSLSRTYAEKLGIVYDDNFLVFQPTSMEDGLTMVIRGIQAGFDIIGVDSVAAMVPKDEMLKKMEDAARLGVVAKKLAEVLPKFAVWLQKHPVEGPEGNKKPIPGHPGTALVFLNQTRALISTGGYGGGGGDDENTAGGKALKFYSYLRLRTARIKSEAVEKSDPITGKKRRFQYGNVTDVKVVKSKVDGKQGHSTSMFIRYGFGIDDYISIIEAGTTYKLIKREGAYYTYGSERIQGRDKFRQYLINNPSVFEEVRSKLIQLISTAGGPIEEDELNGDAKLIESSDDDMEAEISSNSEEGDSEVVAAEDAIESDDNEIADDSAGG